MLCSTWRWSGCYFKTEIQHFLLFLYILVLSRREAVRVTHERALCYISCFPTDYTLIQPHFCFTGVVLYRPSSHFPCGFSCSVAVLPEISGFPSFHTSTSVSPTSCPPGRRRSLHLATPPGIIGDSICRKGPQEQGVTPDGVLCVAGIAVD